MRNLNNYDYSSFYPLEVVHSTSALYEILPNRNVFNFNDGVIISNAARFKQKRIQYGHLYKLRDHILLIGTWNNEVFEKL